MKKNEYLKEVWRRIRERVEVRVGTRRTIAITILSPIAVNTFIYFLFSAFWGIDTANQQILGYVIGTVLLEIILLVAFILSWRYYDVPEEIYNEQREIIDSYLPSQLNIFVGSSPMKGWIREGNKDIRTSYLTVISMEKKKIVEFHADRVEFLQRTADMKADIRGAMFGSALNNVRFEWENGQVFTNLIPGDRDELLITEFDPEMGYPVFAQPKLSAPDCNKPSIYEISIQFKGKREGDNDFAYYDYRTEIYCHPEYKILDFAENSPDIPEELKSKVFFANKKKND
jgi:hypothetical protein